MNDLAHEMKNWRHDIHRNPELGFNELRTADKVASCLQEFGIETHVGIGGTGVVGVLRCGSSRKTIGLRADMDALPIQEMGESAHKSLNDGVFHGCGHDGHTAMLLGAAKRFQLKADLTALFILFFSLQKKMAAVPLL